jgi:Co/Zn/Cd efflux system component
VAHSKDTPEHLQEAGVGAGGGTTTAGSASRSHIRRRRNVVMDWRLGNCRAKRLMYHILIEPLKSHNLDHAQNKRGKSTRSLRVDGYVLNLINDVIKSIKVIILHCSIQKISLIGWDGV